MQSSGKHTRRGLNRECPAVHPALVCFSANKRRAKCFDVGLLLTRRDRSKFGLLERKKDYKARADDFHRKEKALQSLRRKAEERNPDEFYFAMESARTRDGVHIKRCAAAG